MKSWAVTRGPSLVSGEKRLAVHTEDHPIEYLTFEGVIPRGEYGGGTMIVWDTGTWTPIGDPHRGYAKGHLEFELAGQRLNGRWHLVRMRAKPRESKEQWLLIKSDDEYAKPKDEPEIVSVELTSILSGRTNGDLAASDEIRSDHAERAKAAGTKPRPVPELARMPKARKGLLRTFIEPSLATLVDEAPHGDEWIHEIKFDGYRLQARIDGKNVKLLTRKGLDWTAKFKPVAAALRDLKLGSALLDGELVVEDETGLSSFASLQADLKSGRTDRMVFYAFDLLYLDGYDLTKLPLIERKTFLATLLEDAPAGGILRYSSHLEGDGETMIRHACRLGLEGIISKHRDRPYLAGRGMHWQKTKCTQRQEFVIAGYVPSSVSPKAIGSLVLGVYEDKRLVHVGRVGTGFSATLARDLWTDLERLKRPASPFSAALSRDAARGVRWVKPELVAEVEFRGWTTDGILRHASYKGLREDKDPSEIVRETAKSAPARANAPAPSSFNLTHPDRVLWPDTGLTKQGLADYYADIAEWILPHVANRPLSLVRCPSGIEGSCFFQKHAWNGMSKAVQHRAIDGEDILFIDDLEGLIALVQSGVLEIHAWGSPMAKSGDTGSDRHGPRPGGGRALDRSDRRCTGGKGAAWRCGPGELRQDDRRQGIACGRSAPAQGRLGRGEVLRAIPCGNHGRRQSEPIRRHHVQACPRGKDLHRLSAQRAWRDGRRALLHTRPLRRSGVDTAGLERALGVHASGPFYRLEPADPSRPSEKRSLGRSSGAGSGITATEGTFSKARLGPCRMEDWM